MTTQATETRRPYVYETLGTVPPDADEVWHYVSDRYGSAECWTTDPERFVAEFCGGEPEQPPLVPDRYDVDGETILERIR